MGGISVLFAMGIFFFLIAMFIGTIIYAVISYIFESISIMCISKNLKYKIHFKSWIPFYNKYLLGKIVGSKILGLLSSLSNFLTTIIILYCCIQKEPNSIILCAFLICLVVGFISDIIIAHKIYKNVTNKYGDILTVLSVLTFGVLRPIIIFVIRKKVTKIQL